MPYRVYIIRNRDGKFYIGLSDEIERRIDQDNAGESTWTRGKGSWNLIWPSEEMNLSSARKLELLLKRQKGGDGFTKSLACYGPAHNPAPAGSLVQIQPPQPNYLPREVVWANFHAAQSSAKSIPE